MKHIPLAMILLASPSIVQGQSVFGVWCVKEGAMFEITAEGMANFEHTVCTFETPQSAAGKVSTPMTCASYRYTDDGDVIETQRQQYEFTGRLLKPDQIEVNYADGRGPAIADRCEE